MTNSAKWWLTALLMALWSAALAAGNADKGVGNLGNPKVAPPDSMPYGKSYSQWSTEWWLYVMPKTLDVLPFGHGTDGTIGQSGPVWFLGGSFTGDNLVRQITVPAGTALFFPLLDCECSTLETGEWHGSDEASLRACANGWINNYALQGLWGPIYCVLDGVSIKNPEKYRFETSLMSITLPGGMESNIFGVPTTEPTPVLSVGDGIYLFLNPLPVGVHQLEFNGIHYTVTVSQR